MPKYTQFNTLTYYSGMGLYSGEGGLYLKQCER